MADTRELVFQAFRSLGMSPQAALGAMGSLGGESGATFNTKAYNPNDPGGSIGIGQWNRGRRTALESLASRMGVPASDPYAQVAYLKQELQGPYSGVLKQLQGTNDVNQAAGIWTRNYEAPKVDNTAQRLQGLSGVGSIDAQGNFHPGVPGTTITSRAPDQLPATGAAPPPFAALAPGASAPAPAPGPAPTPAEPPSAFEAVMKAYAQPQQAQAQAQAQAQPAAMPPPNLSTNSAAIAAAAPMLQQLIAQKRAEMGFTPMDM